MSETLSNFLKKARKQKKLSLRAVEDATGISNAYLSQLENGKVKQPSPQFLSKLADFYDVDYQHVMICAGYIAAALTGGGEGLKAISIFNGEKLSTEEEAKLLEYLAFIRGRK